MSGRDLADQLQARYPHSAALFMSGYAAGAIVHRGVLEENMAFIQEPFSKKEPALKVRAGLRGVGSAEG
jgi:two-component system, cell cycle sensor histidine kinase and response regulator CckA